MELIPAKKIIAKTKNQFWFGMDYNMNLYRGCHHGCIYCDSRSTCYHVEDFDTVRAKENALKLIETELKGKRSTGVIGTGAMSDPYNREEAKALLTRHALERIDKFGFGIGIATKSALIMRDIDILKRIDSHSPVICKISITTYDDALAAKIEPGVSPTSERFEAVKALSDAGIYTGILMMPILPYINDTALNVLAIVEEAAKCGAKFIYPAFGVTLRDGQREYFYAKLDLHFPGIKEKYIEAFGSQYGCGCPNGKALFAAFKRACESHGILYRMEDIINAYKYERPSDQLSLF